MKIQKWINMIDEYLMEPHSIDKEWVEALLYYKQLLEIKLKNQNIYTSRD